MELNLTSAKALPFSILFFYPKVALHVKIYNWFLAHVERLIVLVEIQRFVGESAAKHHKIVELVF